MKRNDMWLSDLKEGRTQNWMANARGSIANSITSTRSELIGAEAKVSQGLSLRANLVGESRTRKSL